MGVELGQINHSYEAVVTEICPPEFTSPTPGWELQLQLIAVTIIRIGYPLNSQLVIITAQLKQLA